MFFNLFSHLDFNNRSTKGQVRFSGDSFSSCSKFTFPFAKKNSKKNHENVLCVCIWDLVNICSVEIVLLSFKKKFSFEKKKSVSHTRKKSLDKRFFFLFWEKKFCFSFEKKFFFLFFLLGKYSFQNGITRKKQLSPAPQHSRWNSRRNRTFFRVWQPCDWYVTTTVCPRLLNRIQSWNPPPLRHLIQKWSLLAPLKTKWRWQ